MKTTKARKRKGAAAVAWTDLLVVFKRVTLLGRMKARCQSDASLPTPAIQQETSQHHKCLLAGSKEIPAANP